MRFQADCVDACVRTPAACLPFQLIDDIIHFLIVDDVSISLASKVQPLSKAIDGNDFLGPEEICTANRELTDRAAAPDCDHVTRLNVTVFSRHVSRRENVGQEQYLIVRQTL